MLGRDRPNVLTVYSGYFTTYEERQEEWVKLLHTPFGAYEDSLRADLNRVFADFGFDFDRDVSAVHLYRWGHGMVAPRVGWIFGPPVTDGRGRTVRTESPRHVARRPIGRIAFAAQDSEGAPAIEDAISAVLRASREVASAM
jgi:spermidine dehydrogenase